MAAEKKPAPRKTVKLKIDRYGNGYYHPAGAVINSYDDDTVADLIAKGHAEEYTPPPEEAPAK